MRQTLMTAALAVALGCGVAAHADTPPAAPTALPALATATPAVTPDKLPAQASAPEVPTADVTSASTGLVLAMDRIMPGATEDKIKALLPQETRAVLDLYLAGHIREWYFRQDRPGVVFVLAASSMANAHELLDELPLAKAGLIEYDLVPLGPYIPLATLLQNEAGKKTRRH